MTTTIIDVKPPSERAKDRNRILNQTEAFLAKGGKVDVIASEFSVSPKVKTRHREY